MSQDPHDIHCYSPKPVAAQEPIAWLHDGEGRFDAIHTKVKETLDASFHIYGFAGRIDRPAVNTAEHYTVPLYDHAAQCARCAELEAQAEEAVAQYCKNAGDFNRVIEGLQAKITEQAERIKALEAEVETITNRWKHRFVFEDGMQTKLAKADAVILHVKAWIERLEGVLPADTALAAIEQYQKGE